ncbi:MAG: DUF1353 domain-containing protein [Bacilli bacterium]|nr:DUF1353 domain-containing protein [Bacilli bacterium]
MASYYSFKATDYTWHKDKDLYVIDNDFTISLKDSNGNERSYLIKSGFKTDGGSIPSVFQWFAPSWKDDDNQYNACFILHDGLYGSELEDRSTADDMLRSSLRDTGMNRFHASTICWAVNWFACCHYGKKHAKHDEYLYIANGVNYGPETEDQIQK